MVPFFEYFVFFGAVVLHRTTLNDEKNGAWHGFWNFNFSPKVRILHGL